MDLLKESVKKNELIIKKTKKSKYVDQNTINILEKFIIKKKLICYGGIAINNILPKEEQFYDYDIDIPDYDFFSPNALQDAKDLCDIYANEKVYHIESKSAFFYGTYKVFVNFIPIADITQIHKDFYKSLDLPLIAAPLFLISGPEMVIECCKNGIVGTFPALNKRTTEGFEGWIIQIKDAL